MAFSWPSKPVAWTASFIDGVVQCKLPQKSSLGSYSPGDGRLEKIPFKNEFDAKIEVTTNRVDEAFALDRTVVTAPSFTAVLEDGTAAGTAQTFNDCLCVVDPQSLTSRNGVQQIALHLQEIP